MKSPSPPPPPDPQEVAGAQTANNIGTAIANTNLGMVNQTTPYGNLTYSRRERDPSEPLEINEVTSSGPSVLPGVDGPTSTSYRVGGETFDTREAAEEYANSGAGSRYETYTYVDPNTGDVHEIPLYDAEQTLSPEQQRIFDRQTAAQGRLAGMAKDQAGRMRRLLSENVGFDGLPQGGSAAGLDQADRSTIDRLGLARRGLGNAGGITRSYNTDFSEDRRRVEEALMSRLNPSLDRDRESLRSSLISQGIREGSESYDRAMNRFGEQSTDARMQAILAGGQEQSRMVGLEANRARFQNAAQQQRFGQLLGRGQFRNEAISQNNQARAARAAFNNQVEGQNFQDSLATQSRMDQDRGIARDETLTLRNQPINELGALLGTGQVQQPNYVNAPTGNIANVDRAGLEMDAYNQQMQAWQAQNANRQNMMGGLLGLGGNLIMASDRRLKRNIELVGEVDGLNVYEYDYVWGGRHRGYMADEVLDVHPEAVIQAGDFLALDYAKLPEVPQC